MQSADLVSVSPPVGGDTSDTTYLPTRTHSPSHPARPPKARDSARGALPVRPAHRGSARLSPPRQRVRARHYHWGDKV
ncbi:hypothetical protein K523DRAFT_320806, partial [Schizophyllum commune Tattone D]